ncbi:MAG: efflux RND transporter periplasmic adaptor subunit [Pseudochelatococcus sp.]|jgi:multidrug efflux system membrane fusion protein|uniref:efflux RND transporter periplasmic adaptor subunit n=1 Tax=Pseudochelatococcus sp. TaxID=2020869 RepID=UPI003D94DD92
MSVVKAIIPGGRGRAGLSVAMLSLLLLAGCTDEQAEAPHVVRPVKVVEIAGAHHGRTLQYSGSLKARTEMNLGFRVGGKITRRLVDIGDSVTEGEVLARLDAVDYELSLKSAAASLEAARRQVETAAITRNRAEQLLARNVVAKSQFEQADLAYQQAVAMRDSAQSALAQAENQVSYTELKAVGNGIVTGVAADVGQVVGSGTPVVTVAVDGEKEVQIAVPEVDIAHFSPGKAVKVGFWSDAMLSLDGRVREVAGSADPQSRTFAVRVSVPNDPRILLGMTATVKTEAEAREPLISIPLSALSKRDGAAIVWAVDKAARTVHARPVRVADFTADGVRITEGLAVGDVVVTAGTQFMTENLQVKLPDSAPHQSAAARRDVVLR